MDILLKLRKLCGKLVDIILKTQIINKTLLIVKRKTNSAYQLKS